MVRLKHRYLLLEILYPDPSTWPITTKDIPGKPPSHLAIHAPTPDTLTAGLLAKMVREEVAELFGDWGVGQLGGAGINGRIFVSFPFLPLISFLFYPLHNPVVSAFFPQAKIKLC